MAYARLLLVALLVGGIALVPSASATCVASGMVCQWDDNGDGESDTYWVGKQGNEACVNLDSQTQSEGECWVYLPFTTGDYRYRRDGESRLVIVTYGVTGFNVAFVEVRAENSNPSDATPESAFAAVVFSSPGLGVAVGLECEEDPEVGQPIDCQPIIGLN